MAHCCVHHHYLSSLLYISLSMPLWAPYQDGFCLLSCCGGLFFLRLMHPGFPSPLFPDVLQCPQATAMEICFSHTANYLRVVTSLTVPGVNEWLMGHSSHCRGNLVFSNFPILSPATCSTGCAGFGAFGLFFLVTLYMCLYLEVNKYVNGCCETGSVASGAWLVFLSTMISEACR